MTSSKELTRHRHQSETNTNTTNYYLFIMEISLSFSFLPLRLCLASFTCSFSIPHTPPHVLWYIGGTLVLTLKSNYLSFTSLSLPLIMNFK